MTPAKEHKISKRARLSYAIGSIAFGLKGLALGLVMIFYNQVMGLPAAWVSTVIGLALIVDAIVDPLIGHISDNWDSRLGRRHPFMYLSAIPASIAVWALLNPPQGLSKESLVGYLMACTVSARVFISLFEIPNASLLPELAKDYDDRTVLSTYRSLAGLFFPIVVVMIAMSVIMTPFVNAQGQHMPGQLNASGYASYGVLLGAVIFCSIMVSSIGTHGEIKALHKPNRQAKWRTHFYTIRRTMSDPNFLALSLAGMISGVGTGLVGGLTEYFNTYYWELSASEISSLMGAILISPIAAAILGPFLGKRYGKKRVAIWNFFLSMFFGVLPITLRLLDILPNNGSPVILGLLIVDSIFSVTLVIIGVILITSMMADVVEEVQRKTGQRSEGLIFSADTMLKQIVTGVGSMGTGVILDYISFPDKAVPGQVPADVLHRMAVTYLPITIITSLFAIGAIAFYSISRADHERNILDAKL